jgi:hypothetical protein
MATYNINLDTYIDQNETALIGRPNGEKLLQTLKMKNILLKDIEKNYDKILIRIPEHILTMNKSFFLGFLETRFRELGKTQFNNKYSFETSNHIKDKIQRHIDTALTAGKLEDVF